MRQGPPLSGLITVHVNNPGRRRFVRGKKARPGLVAVAIAAMVLTGDVVMAGYIQDNVTAR